MSTRWRPPQIVRPIAIGLVRRGEDLLVAAVQDDAGLIKGWRPLGGTIEFGERASAALQREFIEELGLAITEPQLLTLMEDLYEHHGVRATISFSSSRLLSRSLKLTSGRSLRSGTAGSNVARNGSTSVDFVAARSSCFPSASSSSSRRDDPPFGRRPATPASATDLARRSRTQERGLGRPSCTGLDPGPPL